MKGDSFMNSTFGKRLQMVRKSLGLTRREFALLIGWNEEDVKIRRTSSGKMLPSSAEGIIQNWELGKMFPRYDSIVKIINGTGYDANFYFGIDDSENSVSSLISSFSTDELLAELKRRCSL